MLVSKGTAVLVVVAIRATELERGSDVDKAEAGKPPAFIIR